VNWTCGQYSFGSSKNKFFAPAVIAALVLPERDNVTLLPLLHTFMIIPDKISLSLYMIFTLPKFSFRKSKIGEMNMKTYHFEIRIYDLEIEAENAIEAMEKAKEQFEKCSETLESPVSLKYVDFIDEDEKQEYMMP
jgi:hypothetical protein